MTITIINDCRDTNASGRQCARASSLFNAPTQFIGVSSDLEASGNLIDALDAIEDRPGVILVNVAPRHGNAKKWENGTPFGYFWYKKTLVVSTVDGLTLSLVKKFGLADTIHVLDIPTALTAMVEAGAMTASEREKIVHTQFRSYNFVPKIAHWLAEGNTSPAEELPIAEVQDAPNAVWWVDVFGNCKTTLIADETDLTQKTITTTQGDLAIHDRLKHVADNDVAMIVGSSGLGEKHFLEIVVQGASASERLGLTSGDIVIQ